MKTHDPNCPRCVQGWISLTNEKGSRETLRKSVVQIHAALQRADLSRPLTMQERKELPMHRKQLRDMVASLSPSETLEPAG